MTSARFCCSSALLSPTNFVYTALVSEPRVSGFHFVGTEIARSCKPDEEKQDPSHDSEQSRERSRRQRQKGP